MEGNTVDVGKEDLVGLVAFEIVAVGTATHGVGSGVALCRVDTVNAGVGVGALESLLGEDTRRRLTTEVAMTTEQRLTLRWSESERQALAFGVVTVATNEGSEYRLPFRLTFVAVIRRAPTMLSGSSL